MGIFNNHFGRGTEVNSNRSGSRYSQGNNSFDTFFSNENRQEQPTMQERKNPIEVFIPKTFDEVEKIINFLRSGKCAVVHLTAVKQQTAIRIIDLLSGAVYALGGGVYEMQENIFMFSPSGVEVNQ